MQGIGGKRSLGILGFFAGLAALAMPASVAAQERVVLVQNSFAIGEPGGVLCQVQDKSVANPLRASVFDRRWQVVCRDSARPVADIYGFYDHRDPGAAALASARRERVACNEGDASASPVQASAGMARRQCLVEGTKLGWSIWRARAGEFTYIAEGYSAYDDAIRLALESLIANRVVRGRILVATTSVGDPLAFARVQAETLEPRQALNEGYRRNLGGEYADAAAYFETLRERLEGKDDSAINPGEFLVNAALQKSNLGEFAEADRLFIEAAELTRGDAINERLQRNYEAIHLLNQGYVEDALERVREPLSPQIASIASTPPTLTITRPIASRLNTDSQGARLLGFVDELALTPAERVEIIEAQALQIEGTALRRLGRLDEARDKLLAANERALSVRDGRVVTILRMRAQILNELARISERQGDLARAEREYRAALALLETRYPERRAVAGAQARLAGFLMRHGREDEARALFRQVVDRSIGKRDAAGGLARQLRPYFDYLAPRVESEGAAAEDFFKALQVLVRPGVAETQAILARELAGGSGEAARLFRQSNDLAREIERVRLALKRLEAGESSMQTGAQIAELTQRLEELETAQIRTQAALSAYPQYRAIAANAVTLDALHSTLRADEAYVRLAVVGNDAFVFVTAPSGGSRAARVSEPLDELEFAVDLLRASIAVNEGGRVVTYPYDIETAHRLYTQLFAPIENALAGKRHLIFEPDGPLLRLPVEILVRDRASVDRYLARQKRGGADPFDFTGTAWLARDFTVSTAVSAGAFVDSRKAPASRARKAYLGLGSNAVPQGVPKRAIAISGGDECGWSVEQWRRPIDDKELRAASQIVGAGGAELLLREAFTDDRLRERQDLDQFRILHFATHGLVTPPKPSCPARPALLTSFGGENSDGLLSFDEIFELDLDADLVILSACDTAGGASIEATRAAGVGTGGGTALDGLVRAFIGAGARTVLASHWPAPEDFNATERLMTQMFAAGVGRPLGEALRASQAQLMDEAATSHPYYWGGFSVIGDAARPLIARGDAPPMLDSSSIGVSAP